MERQKQLRGIRGAITVTANDSQTIRQAVRELLLAIMEANEFQLEDVTSVILTMTEDLNAEFPAVGARDLGWVNVPLLCAREVAVPNSLPRVIRVLIHVNTAKSQSEIKHVYRGEASRLRPDLADG